MFAAAEVTAVEALGGQGFAKRSKLRIRFDTEERIRIETTLVTLRRSIGTRFLVAGDVVPIRYEPSSVRSVDGDPRDWGMVLLIDAVLWLAAGATGVAAARARMIFT